MGRRFVCGSRAGWTTLRPGPLANPNFFMAASTEHRGGSLNEPQKSQGSSTPFAIALDKLRVLDDERLRLVTVHCLQNLENPKLRAAAVATLRNAQQCHIERSLTGSFMPIFRVMGYNVRWKELSTKDRRRSLWLIFDQPLPPLNSEEYTRKWGESKTTDRLRAIYSELRRYAKIYGGQPFRDISLARWRADMNFIKQMATILAETGAVSLEDAERISDEVG